MKVAIDAGHGMGNRTAGVYDPGAVAKAGGVTYCEADFTLQYALTLKWVLQEACVPTFLTRSSSAEPCSLRYRVSRAEKAGCTHFISLHVNSAAGKPEGLEVLYRDRDKDRPLAAELQTRLCATTGFRNRGVKQRLDLAVLKFAPGPAVLIELGFINNTQEREWLLVRENRIAVCRTILIALRS